MGLGLDEVTVRAGAWFLLHVRAFANLHSLLCELGTCLFISAHCATPDPMAEESQVP